MLCRHRRSRFRKPQPAHHVRRRIGMLADASADVASMKVEKQLHFMSAISFKSDVLLIINGKLDSLQANVLARSSKQLYAQLNNVNAAVFARAMGVAIQTGWLFRHLPLTWSSMLPQLNKRMHAVYNLYYVNGWSTDVFYNREKEVWLVLRYLLHEHMMAYYKLKNSLLIVEMHKDEPSVAHREQDKQAKLIKKEQHCLQSFTMMAKGHLSLANIDRFDFEETNSGFSQKPEHKLCREFYNALSYNAVEQSICECNTNAIKAIIGIDRDFDFFLMNDLKALPILHYAACCTEAFGEDACKELYSLLWEWMTAALAVQLDEPVDSVCKTDSFYDIVLQRNHEQLTCLHLAIEEYNESFVEFFCNKMNDGSVFFHDETHNMPCAEILWYVLELLPVYHNTIGIRPHQIEVIFQRLLDCGGEKLALRRNSQNLTVLFEAVRKKSKYIVQALINTSHRVIVTEKPHGVVVREWRNYKRYLENMRLWPRIENVDSDVGT